MKMKNVKSKSTLKQKGLPLGERAPLNESFLQIWGVSSFIWDLFGKYSEIVITLKQNNIVFKRDCPLWTKECKKGVPLLINFFLIEVFQNPCGICLENILKIHLPSNNTFLETFEISLSLEKKSIKRVTFHSKLIQKRCSEKQLENGQIHLEISEWNCLPSALYHLYVSRITP